MKLAEYLKAQGMTETAFAEQLGVRQATVNRYVRNDRFPDQVTIERIAELTDNKVTVTDWYEQASEARRAQENAA
jgi:transcriptional regulator with XRE-family HTH domain